MASSRSVAATMLAGAVACADRGPEPEAPRAPLGTTHSAPAGTLPPDTRLPRPTAAPAEVRVFADRVRAIGDTGRLDHAPVIASLQALEEGLGFLGSPDTEARARLRHAIAQLETSPPSSPNHANYVRVALEQVAVIAASGAPRLRRDLDLYMAAVEELVDAVERIDPDVLLLEQHATVREALVITARVLYRAIGLPSPLDSPRTAVR